MARRWKHRPRGSTWGDFGEDDQLGRLNLLTAEKVSQGAAEVRLGAAHERGVVVHASVVPQAPWHLAAEYPSSLSIRSAADSETPGSRTPDSLTPGSRTPGWAWQGPASAGGVARADFELALAGSPGQPAPRSGDRLRGELRFGVCRAGMQCESTVHAFELEVGAGR